jgi:hypothetical protein
MVPFTVPQERVTAFDIDGQLSALDVSVRAGLTRSHAAFCIHEERSGAK